MKLLLPMLFLISGTLTFLSVPLGHAFPENYQDLSAQEKQDLLWEKTEESQWQSLPALNGMGWASLLANLRSAFNLKPTMDYVSDVIPEGRAKVIHTYGVTGKVRFVPAQNQPFTGMFESGASGLVRLSLAADPKITSFTPGMSLKFLIDGKPSLNILAMPSLDGQAKNTNFLALPFTTHVPEPQALVLRVLAWWFSLTERNPMQLPVAPLATVNEDGTTESYVKAPEMLEFVPAKDVRRLIDSQSDRDFRLDLMEVPEGVLFEVYAKQSLTARDRVYIGTLNLESPLVPSEFADKKLFFQHLRK